MKFLCKSNILRKSKYKYFRKAWDTCNQQCFHTNIDSLKNCEKPSSKTIRNLFLTYFVKEKKHKLINSSPVFLNSDPSLLFVNAGMNQFRSVLLNKTYPGHPFYGVKRVANSQKCVRLSGKHNDLNDVGVDLYHHTFFEMLGNWSFGDYSKFDACKMAWELLTDVYGLNPRNLYVTYFGGDYQLGIPPDEECRNVWLEIGVDSNHIFPFGAKDNFWEMANKGPCGPCTEIHYDFSNSGHHKVSQRINKDKPDVMEIWNLVFIQYSREQGGTLKSLPSLNIDTGMGFERLTAVLQGTNSNYDTDIFVPIFKTIETNFRVQPYLGRTGDSDLHGIDTAYRIIADHSRMFSVAIADGLFPDSFDAGHVLRKIIRRAAYSANRVMKTKPGALSSIVPCVAETLDFFPEVTKNVEEIKYVVNQEEKLFHQTINRGRKARNKIISDPTVTILNGNHIWELQKVHGLEENVVQDLADEINVAVDWKDYEKVQFAKQEKIQKQKEEKANIFLHMCDLLKEKNIPLTKDLFKYNYRTDKEKYGVDNIVSSVHAIIKQNEIVLKATEGDECILITDKSNFYSEGGGQLSDIGIISNEDFVFEVKHVDSFKGYVFHHGNIVKGILNPQCKAQMNVDKEYRLCYSQNHTATHLVNAALRKILPYTRQRSSHVGQNKLCLGFSSKSHLTPSEFETIEKYINNIIQQKLAVNRKEITYEELLNIPSAILLSGEDYPDIVSVISIGNGGPESISIEPCCGTHVHNTADIQDFVIIPSKSIGGTTKLLSAVTGEYAAVIRKNGFDLGKEVSHLNVKVEETLGNINVALNVYLNLLKDVNILLKKIQSTMEAPLQKLEEYKTLLMELKLKLNDIINSCSKTDLNEKDSITGSKLETNKAIHFLKSQNISETVDMFKYDYSNEGVKAISADVFAIFTNQTPANCVERGLQCQLILDKTNFYAEEDDQASDVGLLTCKDFIVKVHNVYKVDNYVFHDGFVEEGKAVPNCNVNLTINQEHRLACSQNHTALHLLNAALKKELPYFFPYAGICTSKELQLTFTTKGSISDGQLQSVENFVNDCIAANMEVVKNNVPIESLKEIQSYKASLVKTFKEKVPTISIGNNNSVVSVEPCCGTHVSSTKDIGNFILVSQKTLVKREKSIRAVTGKQAEIVKSDGEAFNQSLLELEKYTLQCLEKSQLDYLELWDCLKELKLAKVYHETDLPLLLFRNHQNILSELSKKLTDATNNFVQKGFEEVKVEMKSVQKTCADKKFIIHKLESVGDGKKIINYAIENSENKPAIYFIKDGHKSVICSCYVPKHLVSPTFSALLCINPVAAMLDGRARSLDKDPELHYSIVSNRLDKIDEAMKVAEEVIKTYCNNV